ncbi:LOG family protein [Microbacterium marinilacus]|uniref:LOG family protein n=1 Tax=Microbacterium marinilacus TaxID=415209 RepID=A0ABP7B4I2_9MICO|nr:Rossmann fold nucleotide-binding protein [Microbacterium marinilacus]MBY0687769.1 Rossmann fold nucleotide-binding protein [Microbacterium marinilacus]
MTRHAGRLITIESLADLDRRLEQGGTRLVGWRVVGLDLRDRSAELAARDTSRTTFAGCVFAAGDDALHAARGALVLPAVPRPPADPRRTALYTADELYDDDAYGASLDGRTYAWTQRRHDPDVLLDRTLHDDGIDRALAHWVEPRRLVGVMGGHGLPRGSAGYAEAARLGRLLSASDGSRDGFTVATGGGPGAMEAANLGARLSAGGAAALEGALDELAAVPSYRPSVEAWVSAARTVLTDAAGLPRVDTLGVPTWHYGHEPSNLFATAIAKYFRNALREAILLQVCGHGIVFLPGAGGTVQEIFQDACENYYAAEDAIAPMVLVGREHWTETLPAWPLLRALAKGRPMERHVHLVDTVEDAAEIVRGADR